MKTRICAFLTATALLSSLPAVEPFAARAAAQVSGELWWDFTPDGPVRVEPYTSLPSFSDVPNSTVMVNQGGNIFPVNDRGVLQMERRIQALGPDFNAPIAFAIDSFVNDGRTPDMLLAGPANPSQLPMSAFALVTPPQPLGDQAIPGIATGGLRVSTANYFGDRTPEVAISFGPGGSGTVTVVSISTTDVIELSPFGVDFTGGVTTKGIDLTRDGFAELVAVQEQGGEAKVYEYVSGVFIERGSGRVFDHGYTGGLGVAGFDLDRNGVGELFFSTLSGQSRFKVLDLSGPRPRPRTVMEFTDHLLGMQVETGVSNGQPVLYTRNVTSSQINRLLLQSDRSVNDDQWSPVNAFSLRSYTPSTSR